MSSISMDVPTLHINQKELQNLVPFIYKHDQLLKKFGALKIQLDSECQLALRKRRKNPVACRPIEQLVKKSEDEPIYLVEKMNCIDKVVQQNSSMIDEHSFWSSLSSSTNEPRHLNISVLPSQSFFSRKTARISFDLHRLPTQSLLRLGGRRVTRQFVPCLRRAHGPGAAFPLTSTRQRLYSIDYHHEGGARHWYTIPSDERKALQTITEKQHSSICLDHGQILIDPSVLDKHHIRYYRITQRPNEFVVLSPGTLAQSFSEDANWSESIEFALPRWLEHVSVPRCRCHILSDSLPETIDMTLFQHESIQNYITSYLNKLTNGESSELKDDKDIDMASVSKPKNITTNSLNIESSISGNAELVIPLERILIPLRSSPTTIFSPSIDSGCSNRGSNKSDENNAELQHELLESDYCCQSLPENPTMTSNTRKRKLETENPFQKRFASDLNEGSIEIGSSPPISIEEEQIIFDYALELFSMSSGSQLGAGHDNFSDIGFPLSPSFTTSFELPTGNPEMIAEENVTHSLSPLTVSKLILVSRLPVTVSKQQLRSAFRGCRKIVFKKNYWNDNFRFALVEYRNCVDAQRNLSAFLALRSSTGIFSGVQARFATEKKLQSKSKPISTSEEDSYSACDLHVGRISGLVSRDRLQQLFPQATSIDYQPGKITRDRVKLGFAFLHFDDLLAATQVMENKDQYCINNQSLSISYQRLYNAPFEINRSDQR